MVKGVSKVLKGFCHRFELFRCLFEVFLVVFHVFLDVFSVEFSFAISGS